MSNQEKRNSGHEVGLSLHGTGGNSPCCNRTEVYLFGEFDTVSGIQHLVLFDRYFSYCFIVGPIYTVAEQDERL